jgi:DNA-binding transcriptional LysR family regulator
MLQIGKIDIMVADTRSIADQDSVEIVNLPKWEACYVCRPEHPLLEKKELVLRDIFSFPIATPWLPKSVSAGLVELAGLTNSDLSSSNVGFIECQYFKVLIETIKACDAVGLGLEPIYRKAVKEGDLVCLPIRTTQITSQFGIISMKGYSLPPTVELFQQYIIKAAEESNLFRIV